MIIDTKVKEYIKMYRKSDYDHQNNTEKTSINGTKITRKQKGKEKPLYGHFKRKPKTPTRRHGYESEKET